MKILYTVYLLGWWLAYFLLGWTGIIGRPRPLM